MAEYISATPTTLAGKALANWDEFGYSNFKYSGTVNVSISNCFTFSDYLLTDVGSYIFSIIDPVPTRTSTQLSNINIITNSISNFAKINFSNVVDYAASNPEKVGALSDINISFISRDDLSFSGISCGNTDSIFGYNYARGDIILNALGGYSTSLSLSTYLGNTLMHEIGHSIGLSHPHSGTDLLTGNRILTADFSATMNLGFSKLGFNIRTAADMDKQYFTMMSYDQQYAGSTFVGGLTPMILDILALQDLYGEGTGSSGTGNTTITPGSSAGVSEYRSYFDLGGTDTIDLTNYVSGAYLNMGTTIEGATHLVGVSMSLSSWEGMTNNATDPTSLRWFYGDFENANGSIGNDRIIGNSLNNTIFSGSGDDILQGGLGNDILDGSTGTDTAVFSGSYNSYSVTRSGSVLIVNGVDGRDRVSNVESLNFTGSNTIVSALTLSNFKTQFVQNDFNGDGTSDILWRNPTNNLVGLWSVSNGQFRWSLVGQVSSNMNLAGMGDFNGDGTMDVLWQDQTINAISMWSMNNGSATFSNVATGSTTMRIAAIGDFNGDGTSDVLWQNPTNNLMGVWSMQGGAPTWSLIGSGSTTMNVAGVGDFNGDGTTDVLWINPTNNLIGVWSMANNASSWHLIGQGSTTMAIAGIGDFNGDGTSDILWQNATNNLIGVWSMNNNSLNWSLVGQGSTTMNIAAIGDYNGDGTSDILWQNPTNNLLGSWTMTANAPSWTLIGQGSTTMKVV